MKQGIAYRTAAWIVVCFSLISRLEAQTWNVNADGTWNTGSNWTGATSPNGIDDTATLGNIITANRTITLSANQTIGTLDINDNNNYTVTGSQLRFNVSSGSADITVSNSGSPVVSSDINLRDNLLITNSGTGSLTLSGVIDENGGARSITHTGSGTTLISGNNTFTGAVIINDGILQISNANALGSTAAGTTVNSGGTLALSGGIVANNAETLTLNGTGEGGGGALRNISGNNTWASGLTLGSNGTVTSDSGTLTIGNVNTDVITLGANTLTFDTDGGNISVTSSIGGTGNVIKDGTGTLRYQTDSNSYTGSTTINDGVLEAISTVVNGSINGTLNIGDGTGAADSAIFRNMNNLGQVLNTATVNVASDGLYDLNGMLIESVGQINMTAGEMRTGTGGDLRLNAAAGYNVATSASATTALIDATGGVFNLNGFARTFTIANGSAAVDLEVRNEISGGTASLTKSGTGWMSMTGTAANTYTGTTTVTAGTLELAKTAGVNSIASTSVVVNSGGTLLLGASNQINNSANMTLAGGTFSTGTTAGFSETLGTLTMTSSSSIDLGTGVHMLNFANSSAASWTGTLTIYDWTGLPNSSGTSGQIFFGNNATGLTSAQLAQISFSGYGAGATLLSTGQLVPIPEPGVIVAAIFILLAILWKERKRLLVLVGARFPCDNTIA